jgi:HlyD family secretion protein
VAAANQDQRRGLFLPGITRGGPGGSGGSRNRQQGSGQNGSSQAPSGAQRGGRRAGAGANGTLWVLRQGAPVSIQVTTGATDGRNTEITSQQLKAGDEVIVDVAAQPTKKGAAS